MRNFLTSLFNLHEGEDDKNKTLENVKSNISFTGSNLWILACAIMIASVGLNVNSTAVIIGAMLISPLMGPIVGAGFALGIYDFSLLRKSLSNLLIATIASLLVSTAYFYISPFKDVQSELLARTSPNIYDVLIAIFGGLAGVIAITRAEKGNPIPGVAIATALMPPLCTAGFGLATGNVKFFIGAIYLYSINCVFICLATFSIVKYLKYPAIVQLNERYQKQIRYGITTIIVLLLIPSIFFAFRLYKEQQFLQRANSFIEKEFVNQGRTLIYKKLGYSSRLKTIDLAFLNKTYSKDELATLNEKLIKEGLNGTKLNIRQHSSDEIQSFKDDFLNRVNQQDNAISEKDRKIVLLEQKLNENTFDTQQLFVEITQLFPEVSTLSVSNESFITKDSVLTATVMLYHSKPQLSNSDKQRMQHWLEKRLKIERVKLLSIDE